jgi:HPt (histidine-containing phosphotransfer) domain-containing protein
MEVMNANPESLARAQALLKQLWEQHKGTIFERLVILEKASESAQVMEPSALEDARSAAHKLAGALGTFGYKQGTDWARASEQIFTQSKISSADQKQLIENVRNIRALLESPKQD